MNSVPDVATRRYRLAPGVEYAVISNDKVVFRSDAVRVKLDGRSTVEFVERVVPLLDGSATVGDIARKAGGLDPADLDGHLASLADAGVVERADVVADGGDRTTAAPLHEMLELAGRERAQARERLARQRIAIFGLESTGALIAREMAHAGVGELILIDPFPARDDDPSGLAAEQADTRQSGLAARLRRELYGGRISTPLTAWDREAVAGVAADADILIATVDRDHAALAHWVNRAAHTHNRIAAFAHVAGAKGFVGPIVFPHETPCFMCYRMRALANESDYAAAMALEESRDRRRTVSAAREPTLLSVVPVIAGMMTGELLKSLAAVGRHAAAGRVLEWDGLEAHFAAHDILTQPGCPVCGKKNS